MMRHHFIAAYLAAALLIPQPTQAGILDTSVDVGLDPATIALIQTLPKTWAPDIQKIIDDAMSRADLSVFSYFDTLDKTISDAVAEVKCAAAGTGEALSDAIRKTLPLVGSDDTGSTMQALRAKINSRTAPLGGRSSIADVADAYADLGYAAGLVSCKFRDVAPDAASRPATLMQSFGKNMLAWERVELLGCNTVLACFPAYRDYVDKLIQNSPTPAVDAAKAATRLARVADPSAAGFMQDDAIARYEPTLFALNAIEDDLRLQTARRTKAARLFTTVDSALASGKKLFDAGNKRSDDEYNRLIFKPRDICGYRNAWRKPSFDRADAVLKPLPALVKQAAILAPERAKDAKAQQAAITKLLAQIKKYRTAC